MSILEQLKALDEQRAKLMGGAKEATLKAVNEGITALNALGFHYSLIEGSTPKKRGARSGQGKREQKNAACPVCKFKTAPLHDGRAHRSQKTKKPFTAAELEERGLKKV